jgi:hypothetical protein
MKRGVLLIVAAMALLGTVGGGAVYAQDISIVNIPFKFTVNHKVMMPGKYEITVTDAAVISVMPERGQAVFVPAITRLAQHEKPITDAMVVFDKLEDQYILSELWLPGEDGFLVTDTKQPHQHHMLKGKKKTS